MLLLKNHNLLFTFYVSTFPFHLNRTGLDWALQKLHVTKYVILLLYFL